MPCENCGAKAMIIGDTPLHDRVYSVSFEEAVKSDIDGKKKDTDLPERDYDWYSKVHSLLVNDQLQYYCLSCGAFNRKASVLYEEHEQDQFDRKDPEEVPDQESLYSFEESEGKEIEVVGWEGKTPIYNEEVEGSARYRCECGVCVYGTDIDGHVGIHRPDTVTLKIEEG